MDMNRVRAKLPTALFIVAVFATFFLLFCTSLRIVPFDNDDFGHLVFFRKAIPLAGSWNPTRIFPEILMPLIGHFTASLITLSGAPVSPELAIDAPSVATAVVGAAAISLYTYCFIRLLRKLLDTSTATNIFAAIFFLLLHFLIFRSAASNNYYLFWSANMTCFYYYTLSNLLAASTVMLLVTWDNASFATLAAKSYPVKCLAVCLLYFSLFSNLYASITLLAYVFFVTVASLVRNRKTMDVKALLKQNSIRLAILVCGLCVQLLELFGGRAASLNTDPLSTRVVQTVTNLASVRPGNVFLFLIALIAIAYFAVSRRHKSARTANLDRLTLVFIASAVLALAYLLFAAAAAAPSYIKRPDVTFGVSFYLVLCMSYLAAWLVGRMKHVRVLVPLALMVLASFTTTSVETYKPMNVGGYSPREARRISVAIMREFQDAAEEHVDEMTLEVPVSPLGTADNWPWATYAASNFAGWAYVSGVTPTLIDTTGLEPVESMNTELGIALPGSN
jgi:hypothetical protein